MFICLLCVVPSSAILDQMGMETFGQRASARASARAQERLFFFFFRKTVYFGFPDNTMIFDWLISFEGRDSVLKVWRVQLMKQWRLSIQTISYTSGRLETNFVSNFQHYDKRLPSLCPGLSAFDNPQPCIKKIIIFIEFRYFKSTEKCKWRWKWRGRRNKKLR